MQEEMHVLMLTMETFFYKEITSFLFVFVGLHLSYFLSSRSMTEYLSSLYYLIFLFPSETRSDGPFCVQIRYYERKYFCVFQM